MPKYPIGWMYRRVDSLLVRLYIGRVDQVVSPDLPLEATHSACAQPLIRSNLDTPLSPSRRLVDQPGSPTRRPVSLVAIDAVSPLTRPGATYLLSATKVACPYLVYTFST